MLLLCMEPYSVAGPGRTNNHRWLGSERKHYSCVDSISHILTLHAAQQKDYYKHHTKNDYSEFTNSSDEADGEPKQRGCCRREVMNEVRG